MLSWVRLRGIIAHSVPPQLLASWYQFYCLVNRDTGALVACPEPLVRKLVEAGIEPATLRSTGRNLNHTTNCPLKIYKIQSSVPPIASCFESWLEFSRSPKHGSSVIMSNMDSSLLHHVKIVINYNFCDDRINKTGQVIFPSVTLTWPSFMGSSNIELKYFNGVVC